MNEKLKSYIILAAVIALPILRELSTNATVDALIGVVAWGFMIFLAVASSMIVVAGLLFSFLGDEVEIDTIEKMNKPFAKMKWWKSLFTAPLVLAAYAYAEWTGPAVVYFISVIGMWAGVFLIRSTLQKVLEANGVVATVEPKDELSKSLLDE